MQGHRSGVLHVMAMSIIHTVQDPDRGCSPVDCAIKYKGTRNFYRNATGKCEPVVPCNTRDKDGVTITAVRDHWSLGAYPVLCMLVL